VVDDGFDIFIFDNSLESTDIFNLIIDNNKIKYFTCGKNLGL